MGLGAISTGVFPSILLLLPIASFLTHISSVESSVSSFRVYNEKRILDRLASAPLLHSTFSGRSGELPLEAQPQSPNIEEPLKRSNGKRKKRIRKVIRKMKRRPTTSTTTEEPSTSEAHQETIPLNDPYNERDFEAYERPKKRRKQRPHSKESDLQRAESANPFVNSSAPISTDFSGDGGGLQFQIQILHPLLNQDSVLSHHEPKVPENKTVPILHQLSDEVAGDVPVTPDLKKLRKKHPLHNLDSIISGETQVARTEGNQGRRKEKISSKIKQAEEGDRVTFVEPYNGRPLSTSFPPITSQTVPVTRQRTRTTTVPTSTTARATTTTTTPTTTTTTTTTTPRPTIRLTNPPPTIRTTTESPAKQVLGNTRFSPTAVSHDSTLAHGIPQVIIFPPEEDRNIPQTTPGIRSSNTPLSPEQDILNQLFGLGQSTSLPQTTHSPLSTNTNSFFDLFNLFQSTTPTTTSTTIGITTPKPSPVYPPTKTVTPPPPPTTTKPRRTTTEARPPPPPEPTIQPTQSQAELDNLFQLALLEGLLQGQTGQGHGNTKQPGNDLSSLLSLLGGTVSRPLTQPTLPPPPTTSGPSLRAALNNMLSVLTNPFNQGSNSQRHGGNQNSNSGLFGSNSIFNLTPGASSTRTTIVPKPTTTPASAVSENELLSQILQLGVEADQQNKQNSHKPTKQVQTSEQDVQSVLGGNWLGTGSKSVHEPPTPSQPSETMQLLNILFNNHNQPARPSGPYWWLDMNAFMGQDPTADPMAGVRPKLGQREYFIKVRR